MKMPLKAKSTPKNNLLSIDAEKQSKKKLRKIG